MELKVNQTYTTQEMIEFFGVSKATWKKKKDRLLDHFRRYYMYEVFYDTKDRRKINYKILKKLQEYEPPLGKGAKRDLVYDRKIEEVIEEDNIQTARNVSRIIKDDTEIVALNHTDNTRYEYTRVRMRIMFGTKAGEHGTKGFISDKIWCKLDENNNCYIELTPEEIQKFYDIYSDEKKLIQEDELTIMSDYQNGLITQEEMKTLISDTTLGAFISARTLYKEKYGYYPIKVPIYQLSAFDLSEQEAA